MSEQSDPVLVVGSRTISYSAARERVLRYTTTRYEHPDQPPYAYPAYDGYPGAPGPSVGPEDLFAPTLLNAPLRTVESYYSFLDALDEINRRLESVRPEWTLMDAGDEWVVTAAKVFGVLDVLDIKGVGLTTLAKVVHRKRPAMLPLWDQNIARCYQGPDGEGRVRLPVVRSRSWSDFATAWLAAVRSDLNAAPAQWEALARLTPPQGPPITPLRALDIVGWGLGAA